ncbi:MAG TPA: hypothetical protein VFO83_14630, partial [Aggregicoccus sp.]|nr:hypothetical protein [Aggregicoccus sp.]
IVPPARLNPDVPPDLDAAVMRALQRDPAARFASAGELERALAQCVLVHATSVDDTDVGEFVRRVLQDGVTQIAEMPGEPAAAAPTASGPERPAPPREPTAVMPGGRGRTPQAPAGAAQKAPAATAGEDPAVGTGKAPAVAPDKAPAVAPDKAQAAAPALAPDEDAHAPTFVLPPKQEGVVGREPLPERAREGRGLEPGSEPGLAHPLPGKKRRGRRVLVACGLGLAVVVAGAATVLPRRAPQAQQAPAPLPDARAERADPAAAEQALPPAAALAEGASRAPPDAGALAPAPAQAQTPAAQPEPALLRVAAVPYATVYLDGEKLGEASATARSFEIEAGRHVVSFRHPSSETVSIPFTVKPGGLFEPPRFRARLR